MKAAEQLEIPFEGPKATTPTEPAAAPDPFTPIRGIRPRAWKMLVYGKPGIGKSTLGTFAPAPLFLDLESGLDRVDCAKTPERLRSLDDVLAWLRWVIRSAEYQTVVIDTIDELERFLAARVVEAWNKDNRAVKTVADIPYGRGGDLLAAEWKHVIDVFDHLSTAGKNVLLIGHEQVTKFENPSDANFDLWTPNLHKKAYPVVTAKLDAVLYARWEVFVRDADKLKGKGKAQSTGERVVHTIDGGSFIAKNRFGLAEVEPMNGDLFAKIK